MLKYEALWERNGLRFRNGLKTAVIKSLLDVIFKHFSQLLKRQIFVR